MEIEHHEKRAFPRKPLDGEGEIDTFLDITTRIKMLDISVRGISFLSVSALDIGKLWLVNFTVGMEIVTVVIRVVYCVRNGLANAYRLGAEFKCLDSVQISTIEEHLDCERGQILAHIDCECVKAA